MVSPRTYWSTDDLWQDWQFWRNRWLYWKRAKVRDENRWGYVSQNFTNSVNAAHSRMMASYDFLCRRKHGLNHPDMSAQLAIEGLSRWQRPEVRR